MSVPAVETYNGHHPIGFGSRHFTQPHRPSIPVNLLQTVHHQDRHHFGPSNSPRFHLPLNQQSLPVNFPQQQKRQQRSSPPPPPPANLSHQRHTASNPSPASSIPPHLRKLSQSPPNLQQSNSSSAPSSSPSSIASAAMYASQQSMSRRTPSTSSQASSPQTSVRRSSSARSTHTTSYVALLRKQKATVWCDRSQAEDPRILAAQRLAKERAEREVALLPSQIHGSAGIRRTPPNSTAGSFTSGVARKIRHHGAQKATTYAGGNMAGAGVPMRLSATEIDDDDDGEGAGERLGSLRNPLDDTDWDAQFFGSGRSGLSGIAGTGHGRSASGQSRPVEGDMIALAEETKREDYFGGKRREESSSPEEEEERNEKKEDELRRRGSVDDRAMTMTGVRLYVANPDLE